MIEPHEIISLLSDLVRIDSANPWLVEGGAGETAIAEFIANWMKPLRVTVTMEEVEDGRKNLVVLLPGTGGGKSVCLYAHLDTVGYALWQDRALIPRVEGDRLYGLGSADDKGHASIAMLTLKSLLESKASLRGDVMLALLIDEEGTSSGAMHFVKHHNPDATIVLESLKMGNITVTHQGFGWLDIIVKGKAAHGSAPDVGVDAITYMAEVVARLHRLNKEVFSPTAHPLNGKIVFHTGTIVGGTDYATYPDSCKLGIEIGTQPGETIDNRVAEIEAIFQELKELYSDFEGEVRVRLARNPFEAEGHEDLWNTLAGQIEKELGKPVNAVGGNSWGDSALFQEAGIPTLELGAEGGNFHSPEEWVSISELVLLGKVLEAAIMEFCK